MTNPKVRFDHSSYILCIIWSPSCSQANQPGISTGFKGGDLGLAPFLPQKLRTPSYKSLSLRMQSKRWPWAVLSVSVRGHQFNQGSYWRFNTRVCEEPEINPFGFVACVWHRAHPELLTAISQPGKSWCLSRKSIFSKCWGLFVDVSHQSAPGAPHVGYYISLHLHPSPCALLG